MADIIKSNDKFHYRNEKYSSLEVDEIDDDQQDNQKLQEALLESFGNRRKVNSEDLQEFYHPDNDGENNEEDEEDKLNSINDISLDLSRINEEPSYLEEDSIDDSYNENEIHWTKFDKNDIQNNST